MLNELSTVFLSKELYEILCQESVQDYPFETCGFIIGTRGYYKTIFKLEPAVNTSPEPNRFQINPFEFYTLDLSLKNSFLSIIGFYHSHPDGRAKPSKLDVSLAWPGYSYIILSINSAQKLTVKSWSITETSQECLEEPLILI